MGIIVGCMPVTFPVEWIFGPRRWPEELCCPRNAFRHWFNVSSISQSVPMPEEIQEQGAEKKTRTHPGVRPSPCSAVPRPLFVCVPAWRHPPRYLFIDDNRKESKCLLNNKGDSDRRQPEVATGTYFALCLGQRCDMRLSIGEVRT